MGAGLRQDGSQPVRLIRLIFPRMLQVGRDVVDAFLPPLCPGCGCIVQGRSLFNLCDACSNAVIACGEPACLCCGAPVLESCICGQAGSLHFDAARSAFVWSGPVRDTVLSLKYSRHWELADEMGRIMAASWRQSGLPVPDLVTAVPLSPRRYLSRGYNQAGLLAARFSTSVGVACDVSLLCRTHFASSTRGAGRDERRAQVAGAFAMRAGRKVDKMNVILVDDVLTTGSTASECARVLKSGGAGRVDVVTFARAVKGL